VEPRPERAGGGPGSRGDRPPGAGAEWSSVFRRGRYGAAFALFAALALVGVLAWIAIDKPHALAGVKPGTKVPPFAAPLAIGGLEGDADIARHAHEGERGRVPACRERGSGILNVCELYERGPVVLALFIVGGACEGVLPKLQAAANDFPGVSFAAVAVKGAHAEVRRLVRRERLTIPVGFDRDGSLATLYGMASCPQLSFVYPGGVMQSRALLETPSRGTLAGRVRALVTASRARGWRPR
jgi:hypothetical protein